jgi:hypothetical protein
MAARYWPVPIRYRRSNLGRGISVRWTGKKGKGGLPEGLGFDRRRRAPDLDVDDGEAPVVQINEGDADDMRRRMASSYAWSSLTIASSRGSEV